MNVLEQIAAIRKVRATPEARQQGATGRGMAFIQQRLREANPAAWAEVERVCGLPFVLSHPKEQREAIQREVILAHQYERGFRLHDVQAEALLTFRDTGQLFAPIGVGWGKTLITLMIAAEAYRQGVQRIILLIPPQLAYQLLRRDIPWARARVVLHGLPIIDMTGSKQQRSTVARSGRRGCYVMSSSMLSSASGEEDLRAIAPSLVIGDEAHQYRRKDAARTKRLMRYINSDKAVRCVWLSGTLTSKTINDYWHLVTPMRLYSPLPLHYPIVRTWAELLDSGTEPEPGKAGPIRPLLDWANAQDSRQTYPLTSAGFRRAYQLRLASNPAVVASGDAELGISLGIEFVDTPMPDSPQGERLRRLMDDVEAWLAPTGDEIEWAIHKYRWAVQLTSGLYYDLFWPSAEQLAEAEGIPEQEAAALLERAKEAHVYLQAYHRELRDWLGSHHRVGMDTPMLVGREMHLNGAKSVGDVLYRRWKEHREKDSPELPERWSRVVRVCDHKIRAAEAWAKEVKHGVLWYNFQAVGEWLAERMPDALHCPAGDAANQAIASSEGRLVIASFHAHGTGKNLQFHQNQLFVEWPRPAPAAEQTLGRTHRFGQSADELTAHVLREPKSEKGAPSFDSMQYAATLHDALYIHQTLGNRQKIVLANYPTLPDIFPRAVLEQRGFDLKAQQDLTGDLAEIFQQKT